MSKHAQHNGYHKRKLAALKKKAASLEAQPKAERRTLETNERQEPPRHLKNTTTYPAKRKNYTNFFASLAFIALITFIIALLSDVPNKLTVVALTTLSTSVTLTVYIIEALKND